MESCAKALGRGGGGETARWLAGKERRSVLTPGWSQSVMVGEETHRPHVVMIRFFCNGQWTKV